MSTLKATITRGTCYPNKPSLQLLLVLLPTTLRPAGAKYWGAHYNPVGEVTKNRKHMLSLYQVYVAKQYGAQSTTCDFVVCSHVGSIS